MSRKKNKDKVRLSGLKIIPLGGLEQIGMNITAFEYEDSIMDQRRANALRNDTQREGRE